MEIKYNVDIKKGWNIVYTVYTESGTRTSGNATTGEMTTKKPDYDLVWTYSGSRYSGDAPAKTPKKFKSFLFK
jgi:hypothetical protein